MKSPAVKDAGAAAKPAAAVSEGEDEDDDPEDEKEFTAAEQKTVAKRAPGMPRVSTANALQKLCEHWSAAGLGEMPDALHSRLVNSVKETHTPIYAVHKMTDIYAREFSKTKQIAHGRLLSRKDDVPVTDASKLRFEDNLALSDGLPRDIADASVQLQAVLDSFGAEERGLRPRLYNCFAITQILQRSLTMTLTTGEDRLLRAYEVRPRDSAELLGYYLFSELEEFVGFGTRIGERTEKLLPHVGALWAIITAIRSRRAGKEINTEPQSGGHGYFVVPGSV